MKFVFFLVILLLSFNFTYSQPDYSNFNHFFGVQINTGITFFSLDPLKEGFTNYVNRLSQYYSIPLEIQHLYPTNISWSAYFFWYFSPWVSMVLGPEYTGTRAYSLYEDFAGTLDLKSEVEGQFSNLYFQLKFLAILYQAP